ncbi:hypothetical protein Tco_0102711 [Tanacetum coccineum]
MSTSKTYQQSLADAGSKTRPLMLERGPYVFKIFTPEGSTIPRLQTAEDLEGDDLLLHDAKMEVMNMILLSISKDIYNSKAILKIFSNPKNNRLRASSNTRNQAIIQGDRVNIQSKNSGNTGRNSRRAYVFKRSVEGYESPKRDWKCSKDSSNSIFRQYFNCSMLQLQWKGTLC